MTLTEEVLLLLDEEYEQCDDSSSLIGSQGGELFERHAALAAMSGIDPKKLAGFLTRCMQQAKRLLPDRCGA